MFEKVVTYTIAMQSATFFWGPRRQSESIVLLRRPIGFLNAELDMFVPGSFRDKLEATTMCLTVTVYLPIVFSVRQSHMRVNGVHCSGEGRKNSRGTI